MGSDKTRSLLKKTSKGELLGVMDSFQRHISLPERGLHVEKEQAGRQDPTEERRRPRISAPAQTLVLLGPHPLPSPCIWKSHSETPPSESPFILLVLLPFQSCLISGSFSETSTQITESTSLNIFLSLRSHRSNRYLFAGNPSKLHPSPGPHPHPRIPRFPHGWHDVATVAACEAAVKMLPLILQDGSPCTHLFVNRAECFCPLTKLFLNISSLFLLGAMQSRWFLQRLYYVHSPCHHPNLTGRLSYTVSPPPGNQRDMRPRRAPLSPCNPSCERLQCCLKTSPPEDLVQPLSQRMIFFQNNL